MHNEGNTSDSSREHERQTEGEGADTEDHKGGVWGNVHLHTQVSAHDRHGAGGESEVHRESEGLAWGHPQHLPILLLLRTQAVFSKELHAIFKGGHSTVCRNYQLKIPYGDCLKSQPLAVKVEVEGNSSPAAGS